jgi:hypothetical protein
MCSRIMYTRDMSTTESHTTASPTQTPAARLQEAKLAFDYALRHGNPGDVSRGRRFLREAEAAVAAECVR